MNELFMLMQAAGQDPARMGPILDALGTQFSPDQVIPALQGMTAGPGNPFAPPSANTSVPPLSPPPGAGVGVGGMPVTADGGLPPPAPQDPMAMIMSMLTGGQPGGPPPGAPPPGTPPPGPPTGRPQAPPTIRPPTTPSPVFSAGVTGSQKAPEIGAQMTAGGTPAQLLLQALLGGGRGGATPNPLRVPTLGSLLAGGH